MYPIIERNSVGVFGHYPEDEVEALIPPAAVVNGVAKFWDPGARRAALEGAGMESPTLGALRAPWFPPLGRGSGVGRKRGRGGWGRMGRSEGEKKGWRRNGGKGVGVMRVECARS